METRLLRGRQETSIHNTSERFGRRTHIVWLCCLLPHLCTLPWSGGVWSNNCVSRPDGSHRRREKRYCCVPLTLFTSLSPSVWPRFSFLLVALFVTFRERRLNCSEKTENNKQHKKTDVLLHLIASPVHSWVYECSFKSSCLVDLFFF